DQGELPVAVPALDRGLALDRRGHGLMRLVPDQHLAAVALGEPLAGAPFVLEHAPDELAGHAGVERAVATARHDVDGDPGVSADHVRKRNNDIGLRQPWAGEGAGMRRRRRGWVPGSLVASLPSAGNDGFF